jgi:hypothetical protein
VRHASLRAMSSGDAAVMSGAHALEVYKKAMAEQAGLCLGRHTHQPSNKSMKNMSREEWAMRCFHEAAADGCLPCVIGWVNKGVDVAWESPNGHFTAMSWIEHQLTQHSGDANKVQRLTICKSFLANLTPQ